MADNLTASSKTPEEIAAENDYLKWKDKDGLSTMTSKYNQAVQRFNERIEQLEDTAEDVNQGTQQRFTEMEETMNQKFQDVSEELSKKVDSVTKEDLGLGNVDNTSDVDKPVSTAQQKAIDDAIDKFADEFTQEVPGEDPIGDDPEVSTPVKQYIDEKIKDAVAHVGIGVASETVLGGIKASEDIAVDPTTGKATVKGYSEQKELVSSIKESLNSNNEVTQKLLDNQGTLEQLQTTEKTSLVGAINETFQLGSERKAKLVENLTAMGVSCSTSDTWESLLAKVLDIFTGTDTSEGNLIAANLLYGKIGFGADGKVVGTMPNRSVPKTKGGQGDDIVGTPWPDQAISHSTLTQYAKYGADSTEKLIVRPPTGYYDEKLHARVYVNPNELAAAIGLTKDKLILGTTVCGVTGTATPVKFTLIQKNVGSSITTTWHSWTELQKYSAILVQIYSSASISSSGTTIVGSLCMSYNEMVNNMNQMGTLIDSQTFNIYQNGNIYGYVYLSRTQGLKVTRYLENYGYRIIGITGFDIPARDAY